MEKKYNLIEFDFIAYKMKVVEKTNWWRYAPLTKNAKCEAYLS